MSDVSGRGVGMDAVRSVVERIGGRVAVESKLGHGATFRLTLPFSVMVTRVMTVETCGQVFGIPLDAIVESLRVPRARIQPIGSVGGVCVARPHDPLDRSGCGLGKPEPASGRSHVGRHCCCRLHCGSTRRNVRSIGSVSAWT